MTLREIWQWLWDTTGFSILYAGWLIETLYLLGLIVR